MNQFFSRVHGKMGKQRKEKSPLRFPSSQKTLSLTMTSEETDTGGWAEALNFCPHVEESLVIPDNASMPDLSQNTECNLSDCSFQVSYTALLREISTIYVIHKL